MIFILGLQLICGQMFKIKAYIASESIYNPRAFRGLEQALDPSRKGPRASRTYIHTQYQDF